ncbi:manganese efflux pump MntP family protein [Stenotrophomonas sp. PS02298]|uniref:manganese efflux pump MntP n=1 Tax=Stenotrophomonas sp. PS02298 TaxID=2991424 RepID=UPI00249B8806|nr:manganese efflux pump MntP family protein [Stenotrophomonas sp. PS02298]
MSPISIVLIGFAMSTDAFAAAVGKGAAMRKPRLIDALRAGLIFGVIEAITPIIGWLLGRAASQYVQAFDHWIAFGLLGVLGAHMIIAGLKPDDETEGDGDDDAGEQHKSFWTLAVTGFATSIDAMAIGVGLAFLDVHIGVVALVIGLCTMVMVTIGIMLGRALGAVVGKRAEIVGGVILIIIGCAILYEHLTAAAAVG